MSKPLKTTGGKFTVETDPNVIHILNLSDMVFKRVLNSMFKKMAGEYFRGLKPKK